jgi:CheY-like chemotaxis protein
VGAEVSEAVDGDDALTQASEWPFDLLLMDLRMPGLDGAAVVARIRAEGGVNDTTPVLAFTAGNAEGVTGFDGVVHKPIDSRALFAAVAQATDYLAGAAEERLVRAG